MSHLRSLPTPVLSPYLVAFPLFRRRDASTLNLMRLREIGHVSDIGCQKQRKGLKSLFIKNICIRGRGVSQRFSEHSIASCLEFIRLHLEFIA